MNWKKYTLYNWIGTAITRTYILMTSVIAPYITGLYRYNGRYKQQSKSKENTKEDISSEWTYIEKGRKMFKDKNTGQEYSGKYYFRHCDYCKKGYDCRQKGGKYCGDSCRAKARRKRERLEKEAKKALSNTDR